MKKIYILLLIFAVSLTNIIAQIPSQFKYQAVLRDGSGNIIANQGKVVIIDILKSDLSTSVFSETHNVTTTTQGLINLNIGSISDMSGIDWNIDEYFIQITVDGVVMGTSQLLSVPYALYAKSADYNSLSNLPNLSIENWNTAFNWGDHSTAGYLTNYNETDPVFTAWDKSAGISITESQISDLGNYLTSETDPVFNAWNKNYADLINKPTSISAFSLNANSQNIINVSDPVNTQDAATKAYVDVLIHKINSMEDILYQNGLVTVTDIDGNKYKTVKIGTQIWMAENLKVTHFPNGEIIPNVTDISGNGSTNDEWALLEDNDTDKAYCYFNDNANNEAETFGALYTYAAATNGIPYDGINNVQGVCPDGWHLPNNEEWTTLINYVSSDGNTGNEAIALKATSGWESSYGTGNGTDIYGFSLLPSGKRLHNGEFWQEGAQDLEGVWWASEDHITIYDVNGFYYSINLIDNFVPEQDDDGEPKSSGRSIRCIKD